MPTFTYNENIPFASNDPSDDQPKMQTNTNSINSIINVDHYSFESSGGRDGYHKPIHMFAQSAPGLAGADGVFYASINSIDNLPWPVWQNAGTNVFIAGPAQGNPNGYISLGNSILFQWGVIPQSSNLTNTAAFSPPFTAILNVGFSVFRNDSSTPGSTYQFYIDNSTVNPGGFNIINRSTHEYGYYWFAIGTK